MVGQTVKQAEATERARARRAARATKSALEIEWFIESFHKRMNVSLYQRVKVAVQFLRDRIVQNISVPVVKVISPRTGRVIVTKRSRPGEFPRADTATLMRTIFEDVIQLHDDVVEGFVGTPLGYGVELELLRDRSFLVRTLNEELPRLTRILTGPIV